jgi:cytoskeletal protein RodZ
MSESPPGVALRRSVSLLATEWWLLLGGVAGYLLFGVWVVATGIALDTAAPSLATTAVTTVGATTLTAATLVAVVLWVVVPSVVTTWLFERHIANPHGNLLNHYRIDNPGVLPAPAGVAMLVFVAAAFVLGPIVPVVLLGAVASTHLLVRTIAYGRRVYSFSPRPLFSVMAALGAGALAAGWLVHAPGLPDALSQQVARAGVGSVVDTGLAIAGATPATALGVLVAVPAALSGLYLLAQLVAAKRVRAKAPLANPDKRAEQRFPIMPPVPANERPGATAPPKPPSNDASDASETADSPESETPIDDGTPTSGDATSDDDTSHTRVFTASESTPEETANVTTLADEEEEDDDGWIDDTDVFSPDQGTGDTGECRACGDPLPSDASVTFCPNCGQKI